MAFGLTGPVTGPRADGGGGGGGGPMILLTVRMVTRQGLYEEARVITGLSFKVKNIIKIPLKHNYTKYNS